DAALQYVHYIPTRRSSDLTDGALDPAECRQLVEAFEASGELTRGRVGGGVHVELKDSHDLTISGRPEWQQLEGMLNAAMLRGLRSEEHTSELQSRENLVCR